MLRTRIIFLDFDGVLNSHEYIASLSEDERGGVIGLDPKAVRRLTRLLSTPGITRVVVSSTWRHNRNTRQLEGVLLAAGLRHPNAVLGRTPRWLHKTPGGIYAAESRGQEIQAWLDMAPDFGVEVESFVIIDDDSDMAHLADRHVKVDFATGLQEAHVDRAIRMLDEPVSVLVVPSAEQAARFSQ
jgi:hypothetical protein